MNKTRKKEYKKVRENKLNNSGNFTFLARRTVSYLAREPGMDGRTCRLHQS